MFAYGINTNILNLAQRCPDWPGQYATGWIENHQMRFEKAYPGSDRTFANIRPRQGGRVYGIVLWLDEASFQAVDRFEGYPKHYERKRVIAHVNGLGMEACWAYWSDHVDHVLPPSVDYYLGVLQGLQEANAPEEYLRSLIAETSYRWQNAPGFLASKIGRRSLPMPASPSRLAERKQLKRGKS